MIPRSTIVAAIAVFLSLAVHFLGLGFTWSVPPQPSGDEALTETVALGNAFEDVAESINEPVRPETAPAPELAVEAAPAPEPADAPTSQALVASANPQAVSAPDTGITPTAQPERTGPSTPETLETPQPPSTDPVGAEERATMDARLVPPAGTDTVSATPQGQAIGGAEPSGAPLQNTAPTPSANLPTAAVPAPPVTITPVPPSMPLEIEPESPQDLPETPETGPSGLAVATSLRPRLRAERPPSEPEGVSDGASEETLSRLAPSQLIESPLTAYKRDGTNVFGRQGGGARSVGQGFNNSGGPGNSDVTNYAGQVLVHLNRTQPVAVSGRGWARVFFQIDPDGTLASVDIIDGSGSLEIDRAAKQQVRNAVPFPRPPGGKSRRLNFVYRIE